MKEVHLCVICLQVILCQFMHPSQSRCISNFLYRKQSPQSPTGLISRAASMFSIHQGFLWKSIKWSQKKMIQICTRWMTEVSKSAHWHCHQPEFRKHLPDPSGIVMCMWKLIIMFIWPFAKCLHVLRCEIMKLSDQLLLPQCGVFTGKGSRFAPTITPQLSSRSKWTNEPHSQQPPVPPDTMHHSPAGKNEPELRWS